MPEFYSDLIRGMSVEKTKRSQYVQEDMQREATGGKHSSSVLYNPILYMQDNWDHLVHFTHTHPLCVCHLIISLWVLSFRNLMQ